MLPRALTCLGGGGGGFLAKRARPKFARAYIEPVSSVAEVPRQSMERLAIEMPRLDELMKFYGIRPAHETGSDPVFPWILLALMLAADYVPNFKAVERVRLGRKLHEAAARVLEIDCIAAERAVSTTQAIRIFAEATGRDPRSVEADYYARRKRLTAKPAAEVAYSVWKDFLSKNPGGGRDLQFGTVMVEMQTHRVKRRDH